MSVGISRLRAVSASVVVARSYGAHLSVLAAVSSELVQSSSGQLVNSVAHLPGQLPPSVLVLPPIPEEPHLLQLGTVASHGSHAEGARRDETSASTRRQQDAMLLLQAQVSSVAYWELLLVFVLFRSLFPLSVSGRCCHGGSSMHASADLLLFVRQSRQYSPHPVLHILLPISFWHSYVSLAFRFIYVLLSKVVLGKIMIPSYTFCK